MFTAATHSTQLTQLTQLALEISQHSSSSGLQKLARFQKMACLLHKSGHIGSFVSFCRRLEVRLLQRRSASHFRKCAIAARQNGNIFNPVMTQTAGVSSGERETGVGADQVKPVLKVAKLSKNATIPTKASAKAAGFDLYSAHDCSIDSMEKAIINTDIQVAVPPGYYGRVAPRSGLAVNHFIDVGAGVVDEDYRGNVGVVLFNFSKEPFEVHKGDRIAQLICERICHPALEQCEALDETGRGAGGFGSTGRN